MGRMGEHIGSEAYRGQRMEDEATVLTDKCKKIACKKC